MEENDRKMTIDYREMIREEIKRPELRQEKREFIARYFSTEPVFLFRPGFFVPALSFCVLFLFFIVLRPATVQMPPASDQTVRILSSAAVPEGLEDDAPPVTVKRVSSNVGPTLVYQKMIHDVPISIVWVLVNEI